jgi:uncharacterized protein (TIGR02246 family)
MTNRLRALILLLWVVPAMHGQVPDAVSKSNADSAETSCSVSADDRAPRDIPERWRVAYNAGDAARVAALYSEDAYYRTQHFVSGILHGRADMQACVQRGVNAKYDIDSIEVLTTQCSSDIAYVITRYRSTNGGRNDIGVKLVILRKSTGQWMIVAHEAAVPDPATAVQSRRDH